ncbi:MAG: heme-binding protein, partial [Planctomycetota bacterium]
MEGSRINLRPLAIAAAAVLSFGVAASQAAADEAQWIWVNGTTAETPIAVGQEGYFRKPLNLREPSEGIVEIAADDQYELFVNGQRVGGGGSSKEFQEYDITERLEVGRNVVAVRVKNTFGATAAMAARVSIRPENADRWYTFSTDPSWRSSPDAQSMWQTVVFNDRLWGSAASFGNLGETVPWDRQENVATEKQVERAERFQIQRGFGVQRVLNDDQVGSVIAMAFNEFGHILVSQENGPLLLVYDRNEDGVPEKVQTYCDQVESVQGILPLNGDVFVTGEGPDGTAVLLLTDNDRNGTLEQVDTIVKFKGTPGEHGPHGLRLGPDGMIYIAVGSHVRAQAKLGDGDTLGHIYEGDLLPRYEDPGGHGRDVKAPGGMII